MKFVCYKNDLNDVLQVVNRAVDVKPMTPILSGVLIRAQGAALELTANNHELGIVAKIPVSVEMEGDTVVSGKRLQDFVRGMPGDTITFSDTDNPNVLNLRSANVNVDLLTMNPDDFPQVKPVDSERSFKINTVALKDMIQRTVFAVAKDDSRPIFTGVLFELDGDKLMLTATNTHRLAHVEKIFTDNYPTAKFTVPAVALRAVATQLNDSPSYLTVAFDERRVRFEFDNISVTARLLEGEFPPYSKIFPKDSATQVTVNTKDFRRALEFVALLAKDDQYNSVRLDISNSGMQLNANSPDAGNAFTDLNADVTGNNLTIAFNVRYLTDALKVVESENVRIVFGDRFSPAALTEPDNSKFIYVITPVRT